MPHTLYLESSRGEDQGLSDINLCRWLFALILLLHLKQQHVFKSLNIKHLVEDCVGSYNFVDRIGYAVVKMCEIEKSRLFKAEQFPSFNPEPILMRGGGILCRGLKRVHKLVLFVGLSPFYRFTFINLESYPEL